MRVRVTPQYRDGRKLTGAQKTEAPKLYGIIRIESERGRDVARLLHPGGDLKNQRGALFNPLLVAMYNDTFSLSGIEKSASGAWVHQTWYCETGGVAREPTGAGVDG